MIDDGKVRALILVDHPEIEPHRLEMEDIDFGEKMGVWYRTGDNLIIRVNAACKGRTEADVAADLSAQLTERLQPMTIVIQTSEFVAPTLVIDFTGKRGRHPASCICKTCAKKAALVTG
jgi:hypothetical protein